MQCIADGSPAGEASAGQRHARALPPAVGALGFIDSEIHKTASGLFKPGLSAEERNEILARFDTRFEQLARWREGKDWIANEDYSVADAYLFVVTRWLQKFGLQRWPWVAAHFERVKQRPAVQQALAAEGLA